MPTTRQACIAIRPSSRSFTAWARSSGVSTDCGVITRSRGFSWNARRNRSEEHTSELQSRGHLVVLPSFPTRRSSDLVQERVGVRLALDPHADPALDNAYHTTSLYCDTAQFEVFHRLGSFKRRKHRLRRYNEIPWIFLERKTK